MERGEVGRNYAIGIDIILHTILLIVRLSAWLRRLVLIGKSTIVGVVVALTLLLNMYTYIVVKVWISPFSPPRFLLHFQLQSCYLCLTKVPSFIQWCGTKMARCEQKLLNLTLPLVEFVYSLTILLISLITISYCFNVITRSRYFFLDVWKWEESMFVQQWLAPSSLFRIGIFSPHKQYPSIIVYVCVS